MVKIRPFLKWAGSKYNCLNEIISSLPTGQRLIEPFAGSGVVFMNTSYSSYLLAESNPDLVNIYRILQLNGESFIDYCQQYFTPEANCKEKYYELRTEFNNLMDSNQNQRFFSILIGMDIMVCADTIQKENIMSLLVFTKNLIFHVRK